MKTLLWKLTLLATPLIALTSPLAADSISFSLLPSSGQVSGSPGTVVGWGYTITNNSAADWFVSTDLNSDSFLHGALTLLFDFPELAPGATVTESFDPAKGIGLFELLWDKSAPSGFVNAGDFVLSGQWWDGDPLNGGDFVADATDTSTPYSAAVKASGGSSATPEPPNLALTVCGLLAAVFLSIPRRSQKLTRPSTLCILAFALVMPSTATAQEVDREIGITRNQADDILKELKQIRQLLESQARPSGPAPRLVPQTGKLRLSGGFPLGSNDAPVTIVEFTDYQCPFCRQFQTTTFAELRKKYIDSGKVRFIIHDFPLDGHPNAMPAAEAARCAGDQGKFWPMHDALFGQPDTSRKGSIENAEALKLDLDTFRSCLESSKHKTEIQSDMQTALSLQITATPSFLIGRTSGEDLDGSILIGAQPLSAFEAKINAANPSKTP